jgi:hypothetical protein
MLSLTGELIIKRKPVTIETVTIKDEVFMICEFYAKLNEKSLLINSMVIVLSSYQAFKVSRLELF